MSNPPNIRKNKYKKGKYISLALRALHVITILNILIQFCKFNFVVHKSSYPTYIHVYRSFCSNVTIGYFQTQFIIITVVTITIFTESHWSPGGSQ